MSMFNPDGILISDSHTVAVRKNVLLPLRCLMAGGMPRDSSHVSSVQCRSGRVPFVVSWQKHFLRSALIVILIKNT